MEVNRNQFFLIGIVIVLLGLEFRLVDSFVLNEKTTRFLAERAKKADESVTSFRRFMPAMGPMPRKTIQPPQWIGWFLVSTGAVLVLHSLAMKKPEGG